MLSEYASQVPKTIATELAGPKGYIRMAFPFELGDDYDMDKAFAVLKAGLETAKERISTLGCEGVPDLDHKAAGVLKLQKAPDLESVTCSDLRDPALFPHTYADLKAKRFPAAALPGELMWRRYTWPIPGERMTVLEAQANFIRGGLVLTCSFNHYFGDVKTYYTWCETWAEECRRVAGEETSPRTDLPDVYFTDREKAMRPSGKNPGRIEDHPEITVLPFTPTAMPPSMVSPEHVGQIFYLSPQARAELKAAAQPANASGPTDDVAWVSNNDAFAALMWMSAMKAQFGSGESLEGDPTSIFNIAVDNRLRTDPPVHPRTLGNFLGWIAPTFPLRKLLTSANVADVAVAIRRSVNRLDKNYNDDLGTLFNSVEDVNRVVATALLNTPGRDLAQTSWINFPLYNVNWGTVLGSFAQAVRCPDVGVINGGCVVLPLLPDGGIEMIIGVDKKMLPTLLADPFLQKFAQPRLL